MTDSPVICSVADGVAHVELNRPASYNALNLAMAEALGQVVEQIAADDDVRVVLVTGRGKAFFAGGDVKEMAAAEDTVANVTELVGRSHRVMRALASLEKPVIAAVHGSVAGAGLGYACAADLVLAGESTKFVAAFTGIGLTPDSGTSWYLNQIVGLRRALELTLTNRVLSAAEALDWGIVSSVHPDDEVLAAGQALAAKLAAGPNAHTLGRTRGLVRAAGTATLDAHLDDEQAGIIHSIGLPEAQALVRAFANR